MAKFINQFEFSNLLIKSVLGKGHDSLSDKKTLDSLQKHYSGNCGQLETVVEILSGYDSKVRVSNELLLGIQNLNIIFQEVNSEEYRCTASHSTSEWAFMSNIMMPQFSCLYTDIIESLNKCSPLKHLEYFLYCSIEGYSPSYSAKDFLSKKNDNRLDIKEELNSIKKNSALTNKSIDRFIRVIKSQLDEKKTTTNLVFQLELDEIRAFLRCSRYLQLIHNHLVKQYDDEKIIEIYRYFLQCLSYAKITNGNDEFINALMIYPRMYIHWHKKLYNYLKISYDLPLQSTPISKSGVYKAIRDTMRSYLYKFPNRLLPMDLINPTEGVIGDIFKPWIDGKTWIRDDYPQTESGLILKSLRENLKLDDYKSKLTLLSSDHDFEHHKHEYLYHKAVISLREKNSDKALELLSTSIAMCETRTAGTNVVRCAKLAIFIKLIINKKMNGGWYKKFMQLIITNIPNEVISSIGNTDTGISNDNIDFFKLSMIVNYFNNLSLLDHLGAAIKFNPMAEFYNLSSNIYRNFNGKIDEAINLTIKGHQLSRPISQPIPFTFEMAIDNILYLQKLYMIEHLPDEVIWLIEQNKNNNLGSLLKSKRTVKQSKEHNNYSANINIEKIANLHIL